MKHRWSLPDTMIPLLYDAERSVALPTAIETVRTLLQADEHFSFVGFDRLMNITKLLRKQREEYVYTYNLYLTKKGWEIEVWNNGGYPLAENPNKPGLVVLPNRIKAKLVLKRRPLRDLTEDHIQQIQHGNDSARDAAIRKGTAAAGK